MGTGDTRKLIPDYYVLNDESVFTPAKMAPWSLAEALRSYSSGYWDYLGDDGEFLDRLLAHAIWSLSPADRAAFEDELTRLSAAETEVEEDDEKDLDYWSSYADQAYAESRAFVGEE